MVVLGCLLSAALTFVLVPPVVAICWRIGAVDIPSDWRRMHRESVTRGGGIAIFLGFFTSSLVLGRTDLSLACILAGGALMLAVGLIDDVVCLDAWVKLLFQIAITVAAVTGSRLSAGIGTLPAVLWVLTLTNAHNFIDGLDGLLSGVAAVEGVGLCLALVTVGAGETAAYPLLLSLACLAFRRFNRYPARVFAGDSGSGTVGFLLGMLSLPLFETASPDVGLLAPLFLFGYPLTDLFTTVLRRLLRGKSPFRADRAHLHHRLIDAGLSVPQGTGALTLISAGLAVLGVLLAAEGLWLWGAVTSAAMALLLMRIRRYVLNFS